MSFERTKKNLTKQVGCSDCFVSSFTCAFSQGTKRVKTDADLLCNVWYYDCLRW